jgi:hypothetical protein
MVKNFDDLQQVGRDNMDSALKRLERLVGFLRETGIGSMMAKAK